MLASDLRLCWIEKHNCCDRGTKEWLIDTTNDNLTGLCKLVENLPRVGSRFG